MLFRSRYTPYHMLQGMASSSSAPSAAVLNGANVATLIPFTLPGPYTVRSLYVYNGAVTGNICMGVYQSNPGQTSLSLILSTGTIVQSGAGTVQVAAPTIVTRLDRGTYYMAFGYTSGAATFYSVAYTYGAGAIGCNLATTGGVPLPSTITTSTWAQPTYRVPWMGISRNTTI